jgi:uncharacterized protein DUF2834
MSQRPSPIAYFYLALALAGAVVPWTYNVLAMRELGRTFTPAEFVAAGFQGSALLGSIAADFWIGSSASLVWMVIEARRCGMRRPWAFVVLTFLVAWACALPLFLFLRERHLARQKVGGVSLVE